MNYAVVIVNSRFLQRPQKPKLREPAYSQTLNQNISIDSGLNIQKVMHSYSETAMVDGVWSSVGKGGMGKRIMRINQDRIC